MEIFKLILKEIYNTKAYLEIPLWYFKDVFQV